MSNSNPDLKSNEDIDPNLTLDTNADIDPGDEERDDAVIGKALKWSVVALAILLCTGGVTAYVMTRPKPPPPVKETKWVPPAKRELPSIEIPEMKFTDITQQAGIDFVHENGARGDKLLPESMGGGCAFLDFDNDGDQDILLTNSRRWDWEKLPDQAAAKIALYANDGHGKFVNVTENAGLNLSIYGMGAAVGDFDDDGNVDLFLSAVGENKLFRNTGGKFEDVTEQSGVAGDADRWSTSCGWVDYDNDGDLDLFVCNYVAWSKDYDLAQDFRLTGGGRAYGRPQDFGGTHLYLYRNNGEGKFTDVSADAGIQMNNPATGVPMGKSLGVSFCDFDEDGAMDILVANDTVQNFLFRNQGDGKFEEIGAISGVAFDSNGNARGAMGTDTAYFRNDGDIGIAIGNFANEMTALYVCRGSDMNFSDDAVSNGLGPNTRLELTFGVFFFDADLDGRLELFAANGHLEEDINKVQESQHYEQPPQLFWNCGPEHPTEFLPAPIEKVGEDFNRRIVGRGAAYADIDGDGDLDVLIAATGRSPRLLRNDQHTGHHWLRVTLQGTRSNRSAIGSWVHAIVGKRILRQQVMPTRSYISQSELTVTFGLKDATKVDKLRIKWPDGSIQELDDVDVDQVLKVEQADLQSN